MALFHDGPISSIDDLMNYETSILDVASTEGIDTSRKLMLAQEETAGDLLAFLLETEDSWCWSGQYSGRRRRTGVGDVVVTQPLKRWHTFRSLAMIFRDAYDNQLNDRYQGKWQNYEKLQRNAASEYERIGVGLVAVPAPKPAPPSVTTTNGPSTAGTWYFAFAWVTSAGAEGLCSDTTQIVLTPTTQALVSCSTAPAGINEWNLYAGATSDSLALQNTTPLAVADCWAQAMPLASGRDPGHGQMPERWVVNDRKLRRG